MYYLCLSGVEIEECVDWMLALEQIDVVNKNQGNIFLYSPPVSIYLPLVHSTTC